MAVLNAAKYNQAELIEVLNSLPDNEIEIHHLSGQRYLACGWKNNKRLILRGTAGNNLGAFSEGTEITLYGNGQEGVANTMSDGEIVVYGWVGDIAGYGMRGGAVYIRDHAGYRLGIHMKAYEDKKPVIVVGGVAGAFAGEYMAGGTIIILGINNGMSPLVGPYCGTGLYGGAIYLRGSYPAHHIAENLKIEILDSSTAMEEISPYLEKYAEFFNCPMAKILAEPFTRLTAIDKGHFGHMYTGFVS